LYILTSAGIFRTNDATIANPVWTKISNPTIDNDRELKGFEFQPSNPNTIYASGRNIYRSTDGGANWTTIGSSNGLDVNSLPNSFVVHRINLAVTNANSNFLYAYIVGKNNLPNNFGTLYIYRYNGSTWTQLFTRTAPTAFEAVTPQRTPIVVSPTNTDRVYFGTTVLEGNNTGSYTDLSQYNGGDFHADVHALAFNPANLNQLYCGTDGGVHIKDLSNSNPTGGVTDISVGLGVSTPYGFDDTDDRSDRIITGNQDTGTNTYEGTTWRQIEGGDGFNGKIDGRTGLAFGASNIGSDIQVFSYEFTQNNVVYEFSSNSRPLEINNGVYPFANVGCGTFTRGHFDLINHPATENMYFVFSELQQRKIHTQTNTNQTSANVWQVRSDIGRDGAAWWMRQFMSEGDIAMSNPNFIVLAQSGAVVDHPSYNGGTAVIHPRLYQSSTGGCNIPSIACGTTTYPTTPCCADITPALNAAIPPQLTNSYSTINSTNGATSVIPIITGVTYHPENHLKAWLSFTGYERNVKVWFTTDGGVTWQNADPNGTLNNLPVNDIVFQRGSNERIYIATDAGIYFRDNSNANWQRYCDFPNVRVVELKINYCMGKIRAATFGRGVWEGDLLASDGTIGTAELAITTNQTWNQSRGLDRNLRVKAGVTLTIQGTTTVPVEIRMPKDGNIIIEKGAHLVLTDARITNGCGQLWRSIEVEDDPALAQTTTNQGRLTMTRCTLQNARNAVNSRWGGAIIQATDSRFINNKRSVAFINYPSNDNLSFFNNCEFTLNSSYSAANGFLGHVTMWNVRGVDIQDCDFRNQATGLTDKKYGIYTIDANFEAHTNCTFDGFNTGVYSTNASTVNIIKVDQGTFSNDAMGIYIGSLNNAILTRNTMQQVGTYKTSSLSFGVFIENSTGFKVEENSMTGANQNIVPVPTGIVVSGAGNAYNRLYKNTFASLHTGIKAEGDNVNENSATTLGLEFLCNSNSNNVGYDFHVVGLSGNNNLGVKQYQGGSASPTGNTFTTSGNLYDFINTGDYAMRHYRSTSSVNQNPNPIFGITNDLASGINGCASMLTMSMMSTQQISTLENSFLSNQKTLEQKDKEHKAKLDAGNTLKWKDQIAKVNSNTAKGLETELMAASPWVSGETFLEVLAKKSQFSANFSEKLIKDNPALMRNVEVVSGLKKELGETTTQSLVDFSESASDERISLENELAELSFEKESTAQKLINHYQFTQPLQIESLRNWLTKKGTLYDHYQVVESYLHENKPLEAQKALKEVKNKLKLSSREESEFLDYSDLLEVKVNAMKNKRDISSLNEMEVAALVVIADRYQGRAGVQARGILNFFYGYNYLPKSSKTEISTPQAAQLEQLNKEKSNNLGITQHVRAFPNPANQEVTFQYDCKFDDCNKPVLSLYNLSGTLIQTFSLDGNQGEVKWNTSKITPGLYIYQFRNEKGLLGSGRISISH
jgi:hypothetical protein